MSNREEILKIHSILENDIVIHDNDQQSVIFVCRILNADDIYENHIGCIGSNVDIAASLVEIMQRNKAAAQIITAAAAVFLTNEAEKAASTRKTSKINANDQ